jgi:hypothetical protein
MPWQAWYTLAVVIVLVALLASNRMSAPVAVMGPSPFLSPRV